MGALGDPGFIFWFIVVICIIGFMCSNGDDHLQGGQR